MRINLTSATKRFFKHFRANKRKIMNNISLMQVTVFITAVSMASFFVNADDALTHRLKADKTAQSESSVNSEATKLAEESNDKFTFSSLDTDKNGMLSQQEVLNGKNDWLVKSFKQIDSNSDESLTEQELIDFVAKTSAVSQ